MSIGINVSGSSSWYASRSSNVPSGSYLMSLKGPQTEKARNNVLEFKDAAKVEAEIKQNYAGARAAASGGRQVVTAGPGTLVVEAGGAGGRQAALSWKDANGEEQSLSFAITDDTRISWDENGAPVIEQGSQALEKGVLKAKGHNDVLIRVNTDIVQGGDGSSTVLNLSEKAGTFIGGKGGMTFMGSYVNSTVTGGSGKNHFAGVFTDSDIFGGDSGDLFSGFFAGAEVKGSTGDDRFSGTFFNKTQISGGEGDDSFVGKFNNAKLYGDKGKNFFGFQGTGADTEPTQEGKKGIKEFKVAEEADSTAEQTALMEQFLNVTIDTGQEDAELAGSFQQADITLGKGKNAVTGFFLDAKVDGSQSAQNKMKVGFSKQATFLSGAGEDDIHMITALQTRIDAGEGNDKLVMGNLGDTPSNTMNLGGVLLDLNFTEFSTDPDRDWDNVGHGTLEYNVLNAGKGKKSVTVATGDAKETFLSGDKVKEPDEEQEEEQVAAAEEKEPAAAEGAPVADAIKTLLEAPLEAPETPAEPEDAQAPTETPTGDLRWDFEKSTAEKDSTGRSADAVQVIMDENQRRTFHQSYGARQIKQRTIVNFASSNLASWHA